MELAHDILSRVRQLLGEHCGFELPDWVVAARVGERIEALGITSPGQYVDLLDDISGQRELSLLVEALRVGETSFFRHRAQMEAIARIVAPTLAKTRKRLVRVWSAGCASGEEPYSIAMLLRRALPKSIELSVLASDISTEALSLAEAATYSESSLEQVPPHLRDWAFIRQQNGRFQVREEITKLVTLERRNLADGGFPSGFDLVLCRNVLIYFSATARNRAIDGLIHSLNRDGYLVVGYAESLRSFNRLEPEQTPDAVIYRRCVELSAPRRPARQVAKTTSVEPKPEAATAPHARPATAVVELRGRYEDGDERLSLELSRALSGRFDQVIVDVDGASYLGDDAGRVLRRALSAASASGVELRIDARRPGPQRWLRRLGLSSEVGR